MDGTPTTIEKSKPFGHRNENVCCPVCNEHSMCDCNTDVFLAISVTSVAAIATMNKSRIATPFNESLNFNDRLPSYTY